MLLTFDTWDHALYAAQGKREQLSLSQRGVFREVFQVSHLHSFASTFIPRAKSKIPDKPE